MRLVPAGLRLRHVKNQTNRADDRRPNPWTPAA